MRLGKVVEITYEEQDDIPAYIEVEEEEVEEAEEEKQEAEIT